VVGAAVGEFVGEVVVGVAVGIAVGCTVGWDVGSAVGNVVGVWVGFSVGEAVVGNVVGVWVGFSVGEAVGAPVGSAIQAVKVSLPYEPEAKVKGPATTASPPVVFKVQAAPFQPSPKLSSMCRVCSPSSSLTGTTPSPSGLDE
jgi:hypothetical protein